MIVVAGALSRADGQVLRYTFDEATSGVTPALDSGSGLAANGAFVGGATRVGGGAGNSVGALDLSANGGVGNWVTAGDADKLDAVSGVTISMWVNLRAATSNTAILASDGTPFEGGWSFQIGGRTPSSASFGIEIWGAGVGLGQGSGVPVDADHKWVMLAGTIDNATHTMRVYSGSMTSPMVANGGSGSTSGHELGANGAEFQVGNEVFSPPAGFQIPAWVDNVRVYDRALGVSELEAVRLMDLPEPCAGVVCGAAGVAGLGRRRRGGAGH